MTDTAKIRQYVAEQFLPDVSPGEIAADFDLIDSGTVDSLSLLRLISWLADYYQLRLDDIPLAPERFRSIQAIEEFVVEAKGLTVSTAHSEGA